VVVVVDVVEVVVGVDVVVVAEGSSVVVVVPDGSSVVVVTDGSSVVVVVPDASVVVVVPLVVPVEDFGFVVVAVGEAVVVTSSAVVVVSPATVVVVRSGNVGVGLPPPNGLVTASRPPPMKRMKPPPTINVNRAIWPINDIDRNVFTMPAMKRTHPHFDRKRKAKWARRSLIDRQRRASS
jgi:hypothetical protein